MESRRAFSFFFFSFRASERTWASPPEEDRLNFDWIAALLRSAHQVIVPSLISFPFDLDGVVAHPSCAEAARRRVRHHGLPA